VLNSRLVVAARCVTLSVPHFDVVLLENHLIEDDAAAGTS